MLYESQDRIWHRLETFTSIYVSKCMPCFLLYTIATTRQTHQQRLHHDINIYIFFATGRLLKHNPRTQVTILKKELGGIAISLDVTYLLVSEYLPTE